MPQPWGVFGIFDQNGNPVITAQSVSGVEYANDYRISDYPQEMGAFESYNKVKVPYQAKVTFMTSGAIADRTNMLTSLEAALASLNLFVVVTPEFQYANANVTHFSYRRTSDHGTAMIIAEVWCEEVRIVSSGQLSNTQSVNGSSPQQGGSVQPQATTPPANSSISYGAGDMLTDSPPATAPPASGTPQATSLANSTSLAAVTTPGATLNPNEPVTNVWSMLTGPQQGAVTQQGTPGGVSYVSPPDSSGNTTVTFVPGL